MKQKKVRDSMTEREAIKEVRFNMSTIGLNNEAAKRVVEARDMAINALEKQIPKKPIFANNMMTNDKFLMCPCCEFRFPDSLVFLKTRCWNCGQKLDWSDEE